MIEELFAKYRVYQSMIHAGIHMIISINMAHFRNGYNHILHDSANAKDN